MAVENTCSILLVDDDRSWQNINKIVLQKHGYKIDIASTKEEAIRKILVNKYEIAVIDLRLIDDDQSNFDGIEIIEELRKRNPDTRILVKSGFLNPHVESELNALGLSKKDVFEKSTTNNALAERINQIHQDIKHG